MALVQDILKLPESLNCRHLYSVDQVWVVSIFEGCNIVFVWKIFGNVVLVYQLYLYCNICLILNNVFTWTKQLHHDGPNHSFWNTIFRDTPYRSTVYKRTGSYNTVQRLIYYSARCIESWWRTAVLAVKDESIKVFQHNWNYAIAAAFFKTKHLHRKILYFRTIRMWKWIVFSV